MDHSASGIDGRLTDYGDPGFSSFLRRAFLASAGYDEADLARPVVAIVDTTSDYTTCHRDMPALVAAARRGVLQGGALPLTLPTLSLGEILITPTSMLYRNLLAMETEEALTAYPMDAAVLLGGCDKTVPAQLMAAASANVPAVSVVTGPMRTGSWRGTRLGACTDCRAHWQRYRAGELDDAALGDVQQELCPTGGTCMVMGTASTMACLAEALGMMLPGGATAPSGSGARLRHATAAGRRAAALAQAPVRPGDLLTPAAFANAVTALLAIGGSTNAIIHLLAISRRAGVPLTLAAFEAAAGRVPLLVNCKPSGDLWLEDLHRAGGMPAVLAELRPLLRLDAPCVSGLTLGEQLAVRGGTNPNAIEAAARGIAAVGASGAARHAGAPSSGSAPTSATQRQGTDAGTAGGAAPVVGTLGEPIGHRGRSPYCAARWHPTGRSSSARPPPLPCCATAGRRWCSSRPPIWRHASTTRRCRSRRTTCWCCATAVRRPPACRRPARCPFPASWRPPGCATWYGYRTRA